MGKTSRKKCTPEFKAQVAIEALKEQWALAELAKKYEVSPTMISHWKANLVKNTGAVLGQHLDRALLEDHQAGIYIHLNPENNVAA